MPSKKRPDVTHGRTPVVKTTCGNMYLTLNKWDGMVREIRIELGKSGFCQCNLLRTFAIYYSKSLQEDITVDEALTDVQKHLIGLGCPSPFIHKSIKYESCIDYIGQLLRKEFKSAQRAEKAKKTRQKKKEAKVKSELQDKV